MTQRLDSITDELASLGLSPSIIQTHAELLTDAMARQARPTFKIRDTCRLDNGGILPAAGAPPAGRALSGYVAFVPAAGAASRYSAPLFALSEALESGDDAEVELRLTALAQEGARAWPLPVGVKSLLAEPAAAHGLSQARRDELSQDLHLPKALMPCVREGVTFLAMKHCEHAKVPGLAGEVYVTPPGQEARFAAELATGLAASGRPRGPFSTTFLGQGPALSTLRFHPDGRPFREPDGRLSPVPAGHGALAQLFPTVAERFPGAHSVFIRNIDNVTGTSAAVLAATVAFLGTHQAVLDAIYAIRAALARDDAATAAEHADALLKRLGVPSPAAAAPGQPERRLGQVLGALFHTDLGGPATLARLRELFRRPVTLLGQVPNTGNDIGGTPCFVGSPDGTDKVCLEVPHASAADRAAFLANPAKATHFNPVFVAAELTRDPAYFADRTGSFWLLAEKTYRAQKVIYVESVLYELLGNSALTNCLFIEVPRLVFNPHKTLKDAMGRTAGDWLGAEPAAVPPSR